MIPSHFAFVLHKQKIKTERISRVGSPLSNLETEFVSMILFLWCRASYSHVEPQAALCGHVDLVSHPRGLRDRRSTVGGAMTFLSAAGGSKSPTARVIALEARSSPRFRDAQEWRYSKNNNLSSERVCALTRERARPRKGPEANARTYARLATTRVVIRSPSSLCPRA